MTDAPAAVVFTDAPQPGRCLATLEPLLGPDGCARLQAALLRRAVGWASAVGTPYVAFAPADAEADVAAIAPDARLLPQVDGDAGTRVAAALAAVLDEHGGPVLLVSADVPRLTGTHAAMALDDLRSGCDVTVGPSSDGGLYLIGVRERQNALFAMPGEVWAEPEAVRKMLELAFAAGLEVGLLRPERDLDDEGDVRALLADPVSPPELVALIRSLRAST